MRKYQVLIYGSYGYTGRLITDESKVYGLKVLLSGRNETKLAQHSDETGLPYQTVDVENRAALEGLLQQAEVVIHCAGPFKHTAQPMANACLKTQTHYTDITGEYDVFELLAGFDQRAKDKGILIMPGVGFDVVPSDCLAVHLKNQLPEPKLLELAFASTTRGMSRGTNKTIIEGMGYGSVIRKDGVLTFVPLGHDVQVIDFGPFSSKTMCIPWGDVSTAWRSTSIENIKVYMAVTDKMIKNAKMSNWLGWLLRQHWVKNYMLKKLDQKPAGPSREKRDKGRSFLWGRVVDGSGEEREARLEVPNGYVLTAKCAALTAERLCTTEVRPGYYTPAQYFGETFILEIEGSKYF